MSLQLFHNILGKVVGECCESVLRNISIIPTWVHKPSNTYTKGMHKKYQDIITIKIMKNYFRYEVLKKRTLQQQESFLFFLPLRPTSISLISTNLLCEFVCRKTKAQSHPTPPPSNKWLCLLSGKSIFMYVRNYLTSPRIVSLS